MKGYLLGVVVALGIAPHAWAQVVPRGPEFQVNTYTTNEQYWPAVVLDPNGGFVVAWGSLGQDGSYTAVVAQRFDSTGLALGAEFLVNAYTTSVQRSPQIVMDLSGGFVLVWESYAQDGSHFGVFGRRFGSGGAPLGGEFQINTYTTGPQWGTSAASDALGNFVVVWHSRFQDGSDFGVFGQRFDSQGAPLGGEFQVNTHTTSTQVYPTVGMSAAGDFVVTWGSAYQDGSFYGVFGQRYDSMGDSQGGEFQINTYTPYKQIDPVVAMDPSGGFVVTWEDSSFQDGHHYGIFGRRFDSAGNPQGGEFQINTYATNSQTNPAVAVDASGGFVVVWESDDQDGSALGVFGQRYDSAGAAIGGEFQVHTYTTGGQSMPSVAMDAAGHFVVAWDGEGQDGNQTGVVGRRFCDDLDADTLCNPEDVIVTSPRDGGMLDCGDPRFDRPTFTWDPGSYDKFRVYLSPNAGFAKGTRVTSGDTLLKVATWTPSGKKWRSACNKALAANPLTPVLFVEVLGVDADLPKSDPFRKTFSQVVEADVVP